MDLLILLCEFCDFNLVLNRKIGKHLIGCALPRLLTPAHLRAPAVPPALTRAWPARLPHVRAPHEI